jgi:redox-sensing transcriptional repressor
MNVTASQIRQDLNCFGGFGQQGYGYNVKYLYGKISELLGVSEGYRAIIVGAGNLGRALMSYRGFGEYGLNIVAAFDRSPHADDSGKPVYPVDKLQSFCKRNKILMGIITVPAAHAQEVADTMIECGIKAIWNFAPVHLEAPSHILIQHQNMATNLAVLSMHLQAQMKPKKEKN